jgi:maltose O-acetyltransferase
MWTPYYIFKKLFEKFIAPNPIEELKKNGMVIGKNFNMLDGVFIDYSHCWHISVGDDVTLGPNVHIFAHDASMKMHLNYARIGKVTIGDRVFVGAGSILLPGVSIGNDVVIGAGGVVSRDIPEGVVAAGNPAKVIASLSDFLTHKKAEMNSCPCFQEEYTLRGGVNAKRKAEMNTLMKNRIGFII